MLDLVAVATSCVEPKEKKKKAKMHHRSGLMPYAHTVISIERQFFFSFPIGKETRQQGHEGKEDHGHPARGRVPRVTWAI